MAVRTVTLSAEPRRLTLSQPEWRRRVERTVAQANAAIGSGRLDELIGIFAELDTWHPQRAYQVRRELTELVMSTSSALPEAAWVNLYLLMADALLDSLAANPAEPALLNYTGVLLYEVGELGGAEALFRATRRLDPELEDVDHNLREVQRRKRESPRVLKGGLGARAKALGVRARRVAAAARPTPGLTLSLVMIVKDEEEMLPGCLAAVRDAVDEMIVVDTGSTDRTVEIAESFGATVVDFPWNGSFADARNVSLERATSDWVLYLDADEHMIPEDAAQLRTLLGRTWREAFYLVETNYTGGEDSGSSVAHLALRLFRNRPEYRFEGRVHEQKTQTMPTYLPDRFETTTIRMRHYGYLKSRIGAREKSRRNIELLQQEARDTPGPFVDFNLGSEYIALGDLGRARAYLDRGWDALREEPAWTLKGYSPMLAARVVQVRRESGDPAAARATIAEALEVYPEHTELVLQEALCARDEGDLDEAATLAERCLELGDAPAKYGATVGTGTYLARCMLAEVRTSQGRPAEAEEQYRRSLEEYPDYIAPLLPLATLMLARDATPDPICMKLAAERPSAALLLGSALYESGRSEEAAAQFRSVLERRPGNGAARVGLVETLLARRLYAEAAAEAALEEADSPVAAVAATAELFARAADGDAAGLAAAFERARERGVAAHDVELYQAWHALLVGEPLPARLPTAAASGALIALEALLRVLDFDAFTILHSLVERLDIDPRERREAIARIYLQRGFLDSAAEEWLAAAESGPDSRAYVGLAQVALARGFRDDARALGLEALSVDPANSEASRLCEALAQAA
ncbi:MAG: glycosyltransferase [Actinomycetia bacterium]|nr:glycosyltransferase [Actinomycetes bacterium]